MSQRRMGTLVNNERYQKREEGSALRANQEKGSEEDIKSVDVSDD